jgi:hypothetical protein
VRIFEAHEPTAWGKMQSLVNVKAGGTIRCMKCFRAEVNAEQNAQQHELAHNQQGALSSVEYLSMFGPMGRCNVGCRCYPGTSQQVPVENVPKLDYKLLQKSLAANGKYTKTITLTGTLKTAC